MVKYFCDLCGDKIDPRKEYDPECGKPKDGWLIPIVENWSENPERPHLYVSYDRVEDCCKACAAVIGYHLDDLRKK